jgi:hypothetical protein
VRWNNEPEETKKLSKLALAKAKIIVREPEKWFQNLRHKWRSEFYKESGLPKDSHWIYYQFEVSLVYHRIRARTELEKEYIKSINTYIGKDGNRIIEVYHSQRLRRTLEEDAKDDSK